MKSDFKVNKNAETVSKVLFVMLFAVLLIYALSIIATLAWGLLTSLKSKLDFQFNKNVLFFPNTELSAKELFQLNNYQKIFNNFSFTYTVRFYSGEQLITHSSQSKFFDIVLNTIIYAGIGGLIMAIVPAVVAYACVKYKFALGKLIYGLNLVVLALPLVGTYPPTIVLLRNLQLYDTFIGNFIQKFNFTGMYFLVYWAFYEGLADAYMEAAEIDGASHYRILLQIVLPLSVKMISTVFLLQFVTLWNDYQTPLMFLPTKPTLAYGVYFMTYRDTNAELSNTPTRISACMLLAIPLLIIFIAFKDKLMGNISIGGVKE